MYAQCPECLTVFSLDADALARAHGTVTCGYCSGTFDALASLADQLPPEPFDRLPAQPVSGLVPRLELSIYRPPLDDALALDESDETVAPTLIAPDVPPESDGPYRSQEPSKPQESDTPEPPEPPEYRDVQRHPELPLDAFMPLAFSPRFARGRRPSRPTPPTARSVHGARWPWVIVCVALLLALGMQLAWAKRDALIADPLIGGWLRDTCATLDCRLPLVQDVRQLQLIARDVRTRPGARGALAISATVRNEAPFAQPYPVVTLTLSDAHGKPVAMRRLRPSEYLADRAALRSGLPPGSRTALLFEVRDPGDAAAVFQFAFE